jgi:hypothetical protein
MRLPDMNGDFWAGVFVLLIVGVALYGLFRLVTE